MRRSRMATTHHRMVPRADGSRSLTIHENGDEDYGHQQSDGEDSIGLLDGGKVDGRDAGGRGRRSARSGGGGRSGLPSMTVESYRRSLQDHMERELSLGDSWSELLGSPPPQQQQQQPRQQSQPARSPNRHPRGAAAGENSAAPQQQWTAAQSMRSVYTTATAATADSAYLESQYGAIDVGRRQHGRQAMSRGVRRGAGAGAGGGANNRPGGAGRTTGPTSAAAAHNVDENDDDDEPYSVDLDEFDRYVARLSAFDFGGEDSLTDIALTPTLTRSASTDGNGREGEGWPDETKFWLFIRSILAPASYDTDRESNLGEQQGVGISATAASNPATRRGSKSKSSSSSSSGNVTPRTWSYSNSLLRRLDALTDVRPIHPARLASRGRFSETEVLTELIRATAVGLVSLRWVQVCDGCGLDLPGRESDDLGRVGGGSGGGGGGGGGGDGAGNFDRDGRQLRGGVTAAGALCRQCQRKGGGGDRNNRRRASRLSLSSGDDDGLYRDPHPAAGPTPTTPSSSSLALDGVRVVFVLSGDVLHAPLRTVDPLPRQWQGTAGGGVRGGRARRLSSVEEDGISIVAAAPPNPTGAVVRYSIGSGRDDELGPALEPGTYRIRCLMAGGAGRRLVVRGHCPTAATPEGAAIRAVKLRFRASSYVGASAGLGDRDRDGEGGGDEDAAVDTMAEIPHGKITLDIIPDTDRLVVVHIKPEGGGGGGKSRHEEEEEDDYDRSLSDDGDDEKKQQQLFTTASRVLCNSTFQRLFPSQLVSSDPSSLLSLQNAIIVFTDVVGATDLATTLGEGPALDLIRQHYQVLFSIFARRGRVIKTVGDKVMTSFTTGRAAVEAAAKALRRVPRRCIKPDGTPLQIRLAIHRGPAVVVPLNGINDYFGQTVNIAARVEGAAGPSECLITDAVLRSDPGACSMYRKVCKSASGQTKFEATPEVKLKLKGLSEPVRSRGFRLKRLPTKRKVVVELLDKTSAPGKTVLSAPDCAAQSMRSVVSTSSSFGPVIDLNGNKRRGRRMSGGISVDLAVFDSCVRRLSSQERRRRPFNSNVWSFIRSNLVGSFIRSNLDELEADSDSTNRVISLVPINPALVSSAGCFDEDEVLTELFFAAKIGLVRIQWVPYSGECGSALGSESQLGKLPSSLFCEKCGINHNVDCVDSIKVVFELSNDVLLSAPANSSANSLRGESTKATSVLHHDLFYELFPNQVVSSKPDVLLSTENTVFVFTDIVGSTDLYSRVGDGEAFRIVRQHFQVLFRAITCRGRVVKTIGDAVMASFNSGRAAIEAAAEALSGVSLECRLPDDTPLQIRIGIHSGPSIVVPLNGVNDYFGRTVNIASRVEGASTPFECLVTESVFNSDPDAETAYNEVCANNSGEILFSSTSVTELNLKGMSESIGARGFRLITRQSDAMGNDTCRIHSRSQMFEKIDVDENDGSSMSEIIQSNSAYGQRRSSCESNNHRRPSRDSLVLWDEMSDEED